MSAPHPAYRIKGPALISFSGGRTSAFMLHEILRAHDGQLPEDVVVAFANTGRERAETLRFVHECGVRWSVRIHWLEYRPAGFEKVSFNSASRNGEPFEALIAAKGYLPNAVTRFCTSELKVRPMKHFAMSLGWERWANVIGLRYDEGHRIIKQHVANERRKERWTTLMPMARARHTKRADVMPFWLGENTDPLAPLMPLPQGFDLGLRDYEGNCDLCMLKSRGALKRLIRDNPGMADWWKAREASISARSAKATATGRRFVTEYSYADLEREVTTQPFMPGLLGDDDDLEFDVECGLICAPSLEAAE
ncbi:phosphoadenosine phosphosulfate reductase family protein [Chenggangzhangella methanolivorans]|uniref:Phosphoadenosine phosphosulfate reductase family protein n=1 Tax=Chenggangzhangella methanolivorans TaxID=1437009 RepID=A0A9E6UPA0_9HYPH|nr:phosphoadenosine phosphosulfate reductase family protein [Chenggangzhangella methanolivorans]QZN99524.1 phosphoadenosine phosphosulfate reductase family protein [Chenggangzhangella methanolivorans]